jgi:hypothetical protein
MSTVSPLTHLPSDALDPVLDLLAGFDLLRLSHVNRQFRELLPSDAAVWQRLTLSDTIESDDEALLPMSPSARGEKSVRFNAMKRYCQSRSFRFYGYQDKKLGEMGPARGGAVLWSDFQSATQLYRSFSIDVSFALLQASSGTDAGVDRTRVGGIVFGAQSAHPASARHANYHQQFIHTDPQGNLYCSVMRHKPIVAKLQADRWYHVVLVFDTQSYPATQRVYLDRQLVHTAEGHLHDEWHFLSHAQVGTGCITGAFGPGSCGWYGFNGLVDEFRGWSGALSDQDVRNLVSRGTWDETSAVTLVWSMRNDGRSRVQGAVALVRCTRPSERIVCDLVEQKRLSDQEIPYSNS